MWRTGLFLLYLDLNSIISELQIRGLDQDKVDSALRCLVYVQAVQEMTSEDGGVLAEDILNNYSMQVVQAATEVFLEKTKVHGLEVLRIKWGCKGAAETLEKQMWDYAAARWDEFVESLNERYLGFFMPLTEERTVTNWKLRKDLKWFSIEIPRHGWAVLKNLEDLTEVALRLDLAFEFRPFGPDGVGAKMVLMHRNAFSALARKAVHPPQDLILGIRLWKFFSEFDPQDTDVVPLMKECGLTLEEVVGAVDSFFAMDLTSKFRDGQYPPYFVNEKKGKEFKEAVRGLLAPMDAWLSSPEPQPAAPRQDTPEQEEGLQLKAA
jgi:hypothetical protein